MRALITGGAGFIGSAVACLGLEKGWELTVLDNFSTGYYENLPDSPTVRLIEGDIRDPQTVDAALKDVNVVFHLAASVGNVRSLEEPLYDSEVNVLGTLQLMEGMKRAGVKRLVYSSSAAIFGEPKYLPIDEPHPCEPDSPYGVSKLAAEKHALCYGRTYRWQVACLRYFNVYGVNQRYDAYGNVIPIFVTRVLEHKPLVIYGDGEQTRDFVAVDDVAQANWLAIEHAASGTYNVGSGVASTINQLVKLIQRVAGSSYVVQTNYSPARPGEVRDSYANIDEAQKKLSFTPKVPLEKGLEKYMEWAKATFQK